jgi:lysophospholipase L1-like esterase
MNWTDFNFYLYKPHLLLFLAFLVLIMGVAHPALGACPDGMAAYWKLDEQVGTTFFDEINTPDGNNGVCAATCPEYYSAEQGIDYWIRKFDGIDQGIDIPAAAVFDWDAGDSFSIELWFKKDTDVASGGEVLIGRHDAGSQLSWQIALTGNQSLAFVLFSSGGDGQTIVGSRNLTNDVWHHIVAIRDGANNKNILYIDGEEEASVAGLTYSSGFGSASAGLNIGWINTGDEDRFEGLMDEVALYDRVLTEEEIKGHYHLAMSYCGLFDNPITIMPLGDSITRGNGDFDGNSYRRTLSDDLGDNNFWVDFVGRLTDGNFSDKQHEGHEGFSSQELADEVPSTPPADVILLHIGTNDLSGDPNPGITGVRNTLDAIDASKPQATVLIARILKQSLGNEDGRTSTFNAQVDAMVGQRIAAGDKLIQVNMADDGLFDWREDPSSPYTSGDMKDWLHPNPSGYNKMADQWYAKLNTFLPMFVSPAITSADSAVATKGQPFQFQVISEGTKPLTFSLLNPVPSGMTIGSSTGIIQWTPPNGDDGEVTIRVSNDAPVDGTTEQDFTVW